MPNRDLKVSIDGDARGFDAACTEAEAKARGLDRELGNLERQQAAQEKVTARTTAAVLKFAASEDRAGLAARKMGFEVEQAAKKAEKAQIRADAAAKAYEKGLISEATAAKAAAAAETSLERASIKAAEAQLAGAAAARKAADEQRKAAEAADKNKASAVGMGAWLTTAGVAAAALVGPVTAAGLAVVGFAAVAAPAIKKVITAQAALGASWGTLDQGQKVSASSVHSLIDEYKALAKSYQPDALKVFNGAVSTARGLLPELGKTVNATKGSVADFATSLENTLGTQLSRVFALTRAQGPQALGALGTTFDQTATLAVSLVHDLAPMGLTLLNAANGGLRLLNMLEQLDPRLVEMAGTLLAVRAPATALGNLWSNNASKLNMFGKAAGEAEKTTSTLSKAVGSSPNLYIGAALAVGLLSYHWATATDTLDRRIAAIRSEASATKNSAASHQIAIAALGKESVGWTSYNKAVAAGDAGLRKHATAFDQSASVRIRKAIDAESKAVTNITQGQNALAQQYGITATQADQLATAAGVDLSKGITGSGAAAVAAQTKISQYRAAVAAASNPTARIALDMTAAANTSLLMKDRLAAVTDALSAYFGPASEAWNATTNIGKAFDDLTVAMKKAHGDFSNQTDNSRALMQALDQTETSVANLRTANLQTKGFDAAQKAAAAQVQVLYSLVGNNKAAREQVDALAKSFGLAAGKSGLSHDAFVQAARDMGKTKGEAEGLWKAYQRLEKPIKLTADDADFLAKLHGAQGLKIDPKTGLLLGNGSDYLNKWLQAHSLKLDPKTGLFRGNNADYYNKWLKANGLHIDTKTGQIKGNTAAFWSAVNAIPSVVGHRTITVTYNTQGSGKITTPAQNQAHGGLIGYAHGGNVARMAGGGPSGPVVGPGSGTSDDIPVWLSNGEYVIRAAQAKKHLALLDSINNGANGFAAGGAVGYATGGVATTPLDLSAVMQYWTAAAAPATKAQYDSALKSRRSATLALKSAEDALYNARHARHPNQRTIAADERRVTADRQNLAAATSKLTDVENRYRYAKLSPVQQLDVALSLGIKDNAAFIKNLQTLADRGFGDLANKLLTMGGPEAEKIAASAVKLNTSKLGSLQGKINQEQGQQDYLANLPNILTVRSTLSKTTGGISSWVALLNATGLDPGSLSAAVKLMTADLNKTSSGKALLADMKAHGYVRGGTIVGPPGTDRVPMWGTAGEYVVNRQAAAANRPLLDALNYSTARVPVASVPVRGGDGASAGPQISQTFQTQDMDTHQLARESAREIAWMLR